MMRGVSRSVQIALVLLAPGFTLRAQHVGPAAGSMPVGHIGSAPHAAPSPAFSGAPHFATPSAVQTGRSQIRPGHSPSWTSSHRPNDGHSGVGYPRKYPIVYAGYPWLAPFSYGLPLAYGAPYFGPEDEGAAPPQQADSVSQPAVDYDPQPANTEVAANAPSPFRPAYQQPAEWAPVQAQPATTLIFKDGRSPVEVHNYALTGSTLYALDGESRQEIPLSQLDVPATIEANRKAGVDFAPPVSR
jgi:hypothetical protein